MITIQLLLISPLIRILFGCGANVYPQQLGGGGKPSTIPWGVRSQYYDKQGKAYYFRDVVQSQREPSLV